MTPVKDKVILTYGLFRAAEKQLGLGLPSEIANKGASPYWALRWEIKRESDDPQTR